MVRRDFCCFCKGRFCIGNGSSCTGKGRILDETLDSVSTVFNEIAQHPPHTLLAICNWSIGHPR